MYWHIVFYIYTLLFFFVVFDYLIISHSMNTPWCPFKRAAEALYTKLWLTHGGHQAKAVRTAADALSLLQQTPRIGFHGFMKLFLSDFWSTHREGIKRDLMAQASTSDFSAYSVSLILFNRSREYVQQCFSQGKTQLIIALDMAYRHLKHNCTTDPEKKEWHDVLDAGFQTAVTDAFHLLDMYESLHHSESTERIDPPSPSPISSASAVPLDYYHGIQKVVLQLASLHISVFSYIIGQVKDVQWPFPTYEELMLMEYSEQLKRLMRISLIPYSTKHFSLNAADQLELHENVFGSAFEYLQWRTSSPHVNGCPAMYAWYQTDGAQHTNIILDRLRMICDAYAYNKKIT